MGLDYTFIRETFWDIFSYVPVTFQIVGVTLLLSVPIAALFTFVIKKKIMILNQLVRAYISLVRGTPIILQLYLIYARLPYLLSDIVQKYGLDYDIYQINNMWYAYLGLALSTVVLLTDVFCTTIDAIDKGQLEAAYTIGFTSAQAYRRIILPQALEVALPILCNIVISMIKNSSLAYSLAVVEVTARARMVGAASFKYVEAYIEVFLVYIIIIVAVEYIFKLLENQLVHYKKCA